MILKVPFKLSIAHFSTSIVTLESYKFLPSLYSGHLTQHFVSRISFHADIPPPPPMAMTKWTFLQRKEHFAVNLFWKNEFLESVFSFIIYLGNVREFFTLSCVFCNNKISSDCPKHMLPPKGTRSLKRALFSTFLRMFPPIPAALPQWMTISSGDKFTFLNDFVRTIAGNSFTLVFRVCAWQYWHVKDGMRLETIRKNTYI